MRIIPSIIERYVGKYVVTWIIYFTIFFCVLSWLIKFMEQLSNIGTGTYTVTVAMYAVSLRIPHNIYVFFPLSALMGTVVSLCMLGSRQELVVMQGAGISKLRIVIATLKFSLPLMIAVMLLAEYVIPRTEAKYDEVRAKTLKGIDLDVGSSGDIWIKEDNKFFHINYAGNNGKVDDIHLFVFDQNTHELLDSAEAKKGTFSQGKWNFENITHKHFRDDKLEIRHVDKEQWNVFITPDKFNALSISPDELSISALWSYVKYLKENKLESKKPEFELYRKIFSPFAIITMICLAAAVAFGSMRSISMSARIVLGVVGGFAFYVSNQLFSPISLVYGFPPLLCVILPSTIFFCCAIWVLTRR